MKLSIKHQILITVINAVVMTGIFLIKYIFLPMIPGIDISNNTALKIFWLFIPIPLVSIVGLIIERHLRFWIIPDFVYCALSFLVSGENCPYGIGRVGLFEASGYSRKWALFDREIAFCLILFMQSIIRLIIFIVTKVKARHRKP